LLAGSGCRDISEANPGAYVTLLVGLSGIIDSTLLLLVLFSQALLFKARVSSFYRKHIKKTVTNIIKE
jgi:hypothetical protein